MTDRTDSEVLHGTAEALAQGTIVSDATMRRVCAYAVELERRNAMLESVGYPTGTAPERERVATLNAFAWAARWLEEGLLRDQGRNELYDAAAEQQARNIVKWFQNRFERAETAQGATNDTPARGG